jgi:hypothetical protein
VNGYIVVFAIMAAIMLLSLILLRRINVRAFRAQADGNVALVERAAMAGDAT